MPVVDLRIDSRAPFADGQEFGEIGAYERIDGEVTFAVDPGNDIFLCGAFSGTVDFDPGSGTNKLTPIQATDGFLTKLSGGAGKFLITKRVGGPDDVHLGLARPTGGAGIDAERQAEGRQEDEHLREHMFAS